MYKIVVSDLDGTLLDSNHRISDYSKKIIKELKSKGVKFILATGRHHLDTVVIAEEIKNDFYLITNNGAKVLYENESVFTYFISEKIVRELLDFETSEKISKNIFTETEWYTDRYIPTFMNKHIGSACEPNETDLNSVKERVIKFFFMGENSNEIQEIEEKLKSNKLYCENLTVSTSEKYCLEVTAKGVNKGEALRKILIRENVNFSDVLAFGDGFNDKEMLALAGKGVIAGHENNRNLKEILPENEITDNSLGNGVADYLKKVFELNI